MSTTIISSEPELDEIFYDAVQTPEEYLDLLENENKMLQKYFDEYSSNIKNLKDNIVSCEGKSRTLEDEIKRYSNPESNKKNISKPLDTESKSEEIPKTILDPKYSTYENMKKRNIPQGGILQKNENGWYTRY